MTEEAPELLINLYKNQDYDIDPKGITMYHGFNE